MDAYKLTSLAYAYLYFVGRLSIVLAFGAGSVGEPIFWVMCVHHVLSIRPCRRSTKVSSMLVITWVNSNAEDTGDLTDLII